MLVPYSRALRARIPAAAPRAELRSPTVRLQVKPTIRTAMVDKDIRRRTRPIVHGRTIPARKKQKVTVTVERRIGRRWVRILRITTRARKGRFRLKLPLLRTGRHRVTVTTRHRPPGRGRQVEAAEPAGSVGVGRSRRRPRRCRRNGGWVRAAIRRCPAWYPN